MLASVPKSIAKHCPDSILCWTSPKMRVDVHTYRCPLHMTAVCVVHRVTSIHTAIGMCVAVRSAHGKCLPQGIACLCWL